MTQDQHALTQIEEIELSNIDTLRTIWLKFRSLGFGVVMRTKRKR
jgi:hypothetical protein